ncbi:MAG: putative DNA-binding domain-containing protein [Gammaproteobacteria bacterium]
MEQPTPSGDFLAMQRAFAAHLRNPEKHLPPTELDQRRAATYCELFYNNVEGFIRNGFPVIFSLMSHQEWHSLIRDFYEQHECRTPYFTAVGREFVAYLESERAACTDDRPFLLELAYYEWLEVDVRICPDPEVDVIYDASNDDLLDSPIVMSPFVRPVQFQYPVHQIKRDFQPKTPPEHATFLVVYRNRDEGVSFLTVNVLTWRLIQLLQGEERGGKPWTGRQAMEALAAEAPQLPLSTILDFGAPFLSELKDKGLILGSTVPGVLLTI